MAQKIEFDYDNEHYVLEFSRNICKQMETAGFRIGELSDRPLTLVPQLFAGAFMLHHKRTKQEKITEILNHFTKKDELIERLQEMFYEAMTALFDEPEENDPKKIEW